MSETAPVGRLSDEQLIDWLRLIRSENIGPRGIMAQTPQGAGDEPGVEMAKAERIGGVSLLAFNLRKKLDPL